MTPEQHALRTAPENQMQALRITLDSVQVELDLVRERLALVYWPIKREYNSLLERNNVA